MTQPMTATQPLEYPGVTTAEHARALLMHLDNAVPYDTTFLFLADGCESIGQGTPLAKAIETAMKASFEIWAASWMRPRLLDIAVIAPSKRRA